MSFYIPTNTSDDEVNEEVTIIYTKMTLPAAVLGVDLLMDFILDGKNEKGDDVIIVTKQHKSQPFITMLS